MNSFADFPYLLHIRAMTPALREAIAQKQDDVRPFSRLPFVVVRPNHPWVSDASACRGTLHEVSETMLGLLVGIDRVLRYGSAVRRMWSQNGNRWASGGDGDAQYPRVVTRENDLGIDWLPLSVPCTLGFPAYVNLSVALRPGKILGLDDPIAVATRVASRFQPVVVAAGNWGRAENFDTLSPLARLPWCISVGATSDPAGRSLWEKSSVASPDTQPTAARAAGPSVVSYGENPYVPGEFGTSFAAPEVGTALLMMTAFLLQVRATRLRRGQLGACPLLLRQWVDHGFKGLDVKPLQPLPMLPRMGVDGDACGETLAILGGLGLSGFDPTPRASTQMMVRSARPISGYRTHEVGSGFVTRSTTVEYLSDFTGLDYAEAMYPHIVLPDDARTRLASLLLAEQQELGAMLTLAGESACKFAVDFKSAEEHSSTPDLDVMYRDASVEEIDPDPFFWPPASDQL